MTGHSASGDHHSIHHLFDTLAGDYQRARPDYPAELIAAVLGRLDNLRAILDAGAGTGISTRLLRQQAGSRPRIFALEPGPGMLAENVCSTPADLHIEFVRAAAESIPLPAGSVDLITAAQAAHWFDRPVFYTEAVRVIRPGGLLAFLYNTRDRAVSPMLETLEAFIAAENPQAARARDEADYLIEFAAVSGLEPLERMEVRWVRSMRVDDFVAMMLSTSYSLPMVKKVGRGQIEDRFRQIALPYEQGGVLEVPYLSEAFMARRG